MSNYPTIDCEELDGDRGLSLSALKELLPRMITKYGEDAILSFDGGYNNVTAKITPAKMTLDLMRLRLRDHLLVRKGIHDPAQNANTVEEMIGEIRTMLKAFGGKHNDDRVIKALEVVLEQ